VIAQISNWPLKIGRLGWFPEINYTKKKII